MSEYIDSLTEWNDFKETLGLTEEEKTEIDLKIQIVGEIINARHNKEITQQTLKELSGVRQPVIARLENNDTDPKLTTILKIL